MQPKHPKATTVLWHDVTWLLCSRTIDFWAAYRISKAFCFAAVFLSDLKSHRPRRDPHQMYTRCWILGRTYNICSDTSSIPFVNFIEGELKGWNLDSVFDLSHPWVVRISKCSNISENWNKLGWLAYVLPKYGIVRPTHTTLRTVQMFAAPEKWIRKIC